MFSVISSSFFRYDKSTIRKIHEFNCHEKLAHTRHLDAQVQRNHTNDNDDDDDDDEQNGTTTKRVLFQ